MDGLTFPSLVSGIINKYSIPIEFRSGPEKDILNCKLSDGKLIKVATPITLTPYASCVPCSARCKFCSEELHMENSIQLGSSSLRPNNEYFINFRKNLSYLNEVPFGISLSGLESTDDPDWFCELIDNLIHYEKHLFKKIPEKILYTNGSGFSDRRWMERIKEKLDQFCIDRIEMSRHHFCQQKNNKIMNFRKGKDIRDNDVFEMVVRSLVDELNVTLVCLPQKNGIENGEDINEYLKWAASLGVSKVIFREFSRLPSGYTTNPPQRYIGENRIDIASLLSGFVSDHTVFPIKATQGYYFWNVVVDWNQQINVTFEASDYELMHARHNSDTVYKLVHHANGNLTAGWSPYKEIIKKHEKTVEHIVSL